MPSFAIRFNANAEEIEELYGGGSDDEQPTAETNESSGPLRSYLPKLIKRSASIDTSGAQDSSPPANDPWRFLSDIKVYFFEIVFCFLISRIYLLG